MDDGGQRGVGVDVGQQGLDGGAFGDVARHDPYAGAEAGQLGGQFGGAVRGGTAPRCQQQPSCAVRCDQVPGEDRADAAGAAGDEHRALVERRGHARFGGGQRLQSRCQEPTPANGHVRFVPGHGIGERLDRQDVAVVVDEQEPARVLGLCAAHQARHGGADQVGFLAGQSGGRVRHDREPAGAFVAHPALQQCQCRQHAGVYVRRVGTGSAGRRPHHRVGSIPQHGEFREIAAACRGLGGLDGRRVAEHDDASGVRLGGGRHGDPLEVEQRCRAAQPGQLLLLDRAGPHRLHAQHEGTGRVDRLHAQGVRCGTGDADAQGIRAGLCQLDAVEGEGQWHPAVGPALGERADSRVEHRVQQCRMQSEGGGARCGVGVERQVGEHFLPARPRGANTLEHRAVPEAEVAECAVHLLPVDRIARNRRPHLGPVRRRGRRGGREQATGVQHPCVGGAGVDGHGPVPIGVGLAHGELDVRGAIGCEDQRRRERQFRQARHAEPGTGGQGQFHESGTRHQDRVEEGVVGEPWVRAQREPAGEQPLVLAGELYLGVQQRMVDGVGTGERRSGLRGQQPESFVLEGIGGQRDPCLRSGSEVVRPPHRPARTVRGGQRGDQLLGFGDRTTGSRDHRYARCEVRRQSGAGHGRQHRVRAQLDEQAHTRIEQ